MAVMGLSHRQDRAIGDLWNRTLSQVPTTFGRIVYLASLRNSNTGFYEHFGLAQVYSQEEADRALRSSHARTFAEWLNYPLAQQKDDLEEYLLSIDANREKILKTWAALGPYRNMLPTEASTAERELFVSDLELIIELLRNAFCPSSPTPGA